LRSDGGEEEEEKNPFQPYESAAINAFISTLPSLDSQTQYPLRLKPFFGYIKQNFSTTTTTTSITTA
jgi:hypothetical protein